MAERFSLTQAACEYLTYHVLTFYNNKSFSYNDITLQRFFFLLLSCTLILKLLKTTDVFHMKGKHQGMEKGSKRYQQSIMDSVQQPSQNYLSQLPDQKKKKKMNTHDPWLEIQNVFSVRKVRKNSFVFIGVMCAGLQVRTPENGFQT